jgi:hypothetical protein
MEENKTLWPETLKVNWQIEKRNEDKEIFFLSLRASGEVSEKIDKLALLETLAGKPIREALFLLENQFLKAEIEVTPFWLRKIPRNKEKIKIKFTLD